MGLFSRKNKDTGANDSSDGETGPHRHNTLHKRPPTDNTNDTIQTSDDAQPNVASGTIPRGRSISPTTMGNGSGTTGADLSDSTYASQSYEDGGLGFGGSRRADYTSAAAPLGTQKRMYGEASGNPGVMSNQVYEKQTGGGTSAVGTQDQNTGVGYGVGGVGQTQKKSSHTGPDIGIAAGAGAAGLAAAEVAQNGVRTHQQSSTVPGGFPSEDTFNDTNKSRDVNDNQTTIGAGTTKRQSRGANMNGTTTDRAGIPTGQPREMYGGHTAGRSEGFAQETMESARAKLKAALEAEEAALGLVASARLAAKEAKDIIAHLGAQAEEEARLASIKQREAGTLLEQSSHLGRV
ncbi:hypothetical protein FRB96_005024 [Tulasnella sp. 330]|nr:hypothetical protein FRB96_005024 [Tulasnella sp. 330]